MNDETATLMNNEQFENLTEWILKIRPNENRKSDRLGHFLLMQKINFYVINFGIN